MTYYTSNSKKGSAWDLLLDATAKSNGRITSFTELKHVYHCTNENIHYLFYMTVK